MLLDCLRYLPTDGFIDAGICGGFHSLIFLMTNGKCPFGQVLYRSCRDPSYSTTSL